MKAPHKTARTIKPYSCIFSGCKITVPVGSIVSNKTACGNDDEYRFWQDFSKTAEELTGFKNSLLFHDLKYYGLNIPAEYCEKY